MKTDQITYGNKTYIYSYMVSHVYGKVYSFSRGLLRSISRHKAKGVFFPGGCQGLWGHLELCLQVWRVDRLGALRLLVWVPLFVE